MIGIRLVAFLLVLLFSCSSYTSLYLAVVYVLPGCINLLTVSVYIILKYCKCMIDLKHFILMSENIIFKFN